MSHDPAASPPALQPEFTVRCLLSEYSALSDFQKEAKNNFIRYALTHNTALLAMLGWMADRYLTAGSQIELVLRRHHPLLLAMLLIPILNSMFIVLCANQLHSFFSVARYFQDVKKLLRDLGAERALGYEDKFSNAVVMNRAVTTTLDVTAGAIWFAVPILLGLSAVVAIPLLLADMTRMEWAVYGVSAAFTVAAIGYLLACFIFMRRVQAYDPMAAPRRGS